MIFNIIINIILETCISTLESNIGNHIQKYIFFMCLYAILQVYNFNSNFIQSHNKMIEFQKFQLNKYEKLDDVSKEKDTIDSFKDKLDRASNAVRTKYSWQINIITLFISCITSLSIILHLFH